MILGEATYEAYGYYFHALSRRSGKPVLAVCDNCGKLRTVRKHHYRALCKACAHKGVLVGAKNPNYGKPAWNKGIPHTEKSKQKMSEAHKGSCTGENNSNYGNRGDKNPLFGVKAEKHFNWRGGAKASNARHTAKRRQFGFIPLNTSFENSEAHHLTHNSVVYIPKALHRSIYHALNSGQNMYTINALALRFLLEGF